MKTFLGVTLLSLHAESGAPGSVTVASFLLVTMTGPKGFDPSPRQPTRPRDRLVQEESVASSSHQNWRTLLSAMPPTSVCGGWPSALQK